jgi:hypothetical protein
VRTLQATRYLTPLREGGSLPAIVEADDDGLYVLKFRGAGQGPKALIAELVAGELARALGLPVPEIVFMQLDVELARTEPDPEIQDLIRASGGLNLALDYLPGSVSFDPLTMPAGGALASSIVWLDALVGNVDRSPRNVNLLWWHGRLWLIDHGAALVFQHQWDGFLARSTLPFMPIKDHVLLPFANALAEADTLLAPRLSPTVIDTIVQRIPDDWLQPDPLFADRAAQRDAYRQYFLARLRSPRAFVQEALRVHAAVRAHAPL